MLVTVLIIFDHFGHQHPLKKIIFSLDRRTPTFIRCHQHQNWVINIHKSSPTLNHQHYDVANIPRNRVLSFKKWTFWISSSELNLGSKRESSGQGSTDRKSKVTSITATVFSFQTSGLSKLLRFNQVRSISFQNYWKPTNHKIRIWKSFIMRNDNVRNVTLQKKNWFDLESDSVASGLVEMIYSRPSPVSNTKLL